MRHLTKNVQIQLNRLIIVLFALSAWLIPIGSYAQDSTSTRIDTTETWIDSLVTSAVLSTKSTILKEYYTLHIPSDRFRSDGQIVIYDGPWYRLKRADIHILDQTGKLLRTILQKEMNRQCGYGDYYSVYEDHCVLYTDPSYPSYPHTIAVRTEHELPGSFALSSLFRQRSYPIAHAQISLKWDLSMSPRWKWYGSLNVIEAKSADSAHWELSHIPKWKAPPFSVGIDRPAELVVQTESVTIGNQYYLMRTWDEIASLYRQLARDRYVIDSLSYQKFRDGSIEAAYHDLIQKVRYVFVSIDISGWQPEYARTVEKVGYGDCKGVTTLLIARARNAGLTAWPVLVQTEGDYRVDPTFPSDRFNHVIAMVIKGNDTLWFDPTCRVCPAGEMPASDEGLLGLAITDVAGVLVRVPKSYAEHNTTTATAHITVDSTGGVKWSEQSTRTGNDAISMRYSLQSSSNEERMEMIRRALQTARVDLEPISFSHEHFDDIQKPLITRVVLESSRPLPQSGVSFFTPTAFLQNDRFDPLLTSTDSGSLNINYPRTSTDSFTISGEYFSGCDSVRLPPTDSIAFVGGFWSIRWEMNENEIVGISTARFDSSHITASDRSAFMSALKRRRTILRTPLKCYRRSH